MTVGMVHHKRDVFSLSYSLKIKLCSSSDKPAVWVPVMHVIGSSVQLLKWHGQDSALNELIIVYCNE